ncbi:MAG: CDP-alcohol phosphatidyltransferase family protein [Ignavibacteriae bacterium]|nr:CDP-alcohol phosphatidyltransferase family protein [Ignavibacteriota bacterium]
MPLTPLVIERNFNRLLDSLVDVLSLSRIHANTISTIGIFPSIAAAYFSSQGQFTVGGILILIGGLLDMLDGKVARLNGHVSKFGAIYDATLDRLAELVIYTGIGIYFIQHNMHLTSLVVVVAVGSSLLVSYVRARAESHGIPCEVGFLRRGDRIVLLGAGAFFDFMADVFHAIVQGIITLLGLEVRYAFPPMPLTLVLMVIAVLSPITVVQRLMYISKLSTHKIE